MKSNKSKSHVNIGALGHGKATLTAAILAGYLHRSSLKEVSLLALAEFDSKGKPEQNITLVVGHDSSTVDIRTLSQKLPQAVDSKISAWNHPWPPSPRQWKRM